MKVRIEYSHFVDVDIDPELLMPDGNGYYGPNKLEFDEMLGSFLMLDSLLPPSLIPVEAIIVGWEYSDLDLEAYEKLKAGIASE
mgnify:CR=1 FL=1